MILPKNSAADRKLPYSPLLKEKSNVLPIQNRGDSIIGNIDIAMTLPAFVTQTPPLP
jgi:hypothetical protein